MKKKVLMLIAMLYAISLPLFADEISDLKKDVQNLKERVTEINNAQPLKDTKTWGNGFTIGVPLGFYNSDPVYGLEMGYTALPNMIIRLDAHFFWHKNTFSKMNLMSMMQQPGNTMIAYPSVGMVIRSPIIYNTRIYGGFFFGIWYDLNRKIGPNFQLRGLGGVEVYANKHQAFFIEVGGGGVIGTRKNIYYGGGVIITGGSRFYI